MTSHPSQPGYVVPGHGNATAVFGYDPEDRDLPCLVAIQVAIEAGVPVCNRLELVRRPGALPLTSAQLRRIPVGALLEHAFLRHMTYPGPGGLADARAALRKRRGGGTRRRELTGSFLLDVAAVYRAAVAQGKAPVREVARRLDPEWRRLEQKHQAAEPRTAARWVYLARKRGLLGATVPGRKGEHVDIATTEATP